MSEQAPQRTTRSGRRPKSPAFQFYPADYLSSRTIRRLTLEQRGAWLELICSEWLDGPLENDPVELARIIGVSAKEFRRIWPGLDRCFDLENGRLVNPRLEREREAQEANRERWQRLGKAGNDARHGSAKGGDGAPNRDDPASRSAPVREQHGTSTGSSTARSSSPLSSLPREEQESPSGIPPVAPAPGGEKPARARKPASGPQAELIRHFEAEWARTRPGVELVFRPREAVAAARLVKSPGLEESCRRVTWMLEDQDPWAIANAALSVLDSRPNRWAVAPTRPSSSTHAAPAPGGLQDLFGRGPHATPRTITTTAEVRHAEAG